MPAHRSSSWPLGWTWAGLIVYASLHPFARWQLPVLAPGRTWPDLLWLPIERYTSFDLWSNYLAYLPFGLLLTLAWLRGGTGPLRAGLQAAACCSLLSLSMEWTQYFLPLRVPSRVDWVANTAGGATGVVLALVLARLGALERWQRVRDALFVPHGTLGLVLVLCWPIGLLFPPPVPLATGQGLSRLGAVLAEWLVGTPLDGWLPASTPVGPLPPGVEAVVTGLGLLAPCLVSFVMLRRIRFRLFTLAAGAVLGVSVTTLSTLLNFGPDHALSWLTPPVAPGLLIGLGLGLGLAFLPRRTVAALGLVALTVMITLVNQAGSDPYFASSLNGWEQGRFIRFHGVAQWIGWVWPFAALVFLMIQTGPRSPLHPPAAPTTLT